MVKVAEDHLVTVQTTDLEKMADVVRVAVRHHKARDQSNAHLHMTPARYSPLTASLETVAARLEALASGIREDEETDE